jgi:hypothetical protein
VWSKVVVGCWSGCDVAACVEFGSQGWSRSRFVEDGANDWRLIAMRIRCDTSYGRFTATTWKRVVLRSQG